MLDIPAAVALIDALDKLGARFIGGIIDAKKIVGEAVGIPVTDLGEIPPGFRREQKPKAPPVDSRLCDDTGEERRPRRSHAHSANKMKSDATNVRVPLDVPPTARGAYVEGRIAFAAGQALESNPHPPMDRGIGHARREAWGRAWTEAKDAKAEEAKKAMVTP